MSATVSRGGPYRVIARDRRDAYGWFWSHFEGSTEALKYNLRDLETVDRVIGLTPRRRVAVQAGGNLGIFAKRLAQDFEHVYTFEPDPENFAALCKNAPERNIIKLQAVVGPDEQVRGFSMATHRRDGKPTDHEGIRHVDGPGPYPVLRIDSVVDICDLLYLDVEGFELFALQGADRILHASRPVIAVEVNDKHLVHYGVTADEVRREITRHEYRLAFTAHSDEVYTPV